MYVLSYFMLGQHNSGEDVNFNRPLGMRRYAYHDRSFPFDPWMFRPIAWAEYRIRGKESQVVIQDGRLRGGQPTYGYGPFK